MTTQQIYFVDSSVVDYASLVTTLPAGSEWYLLDASQDGLSQVSAILAGHDGLDAIHIVSHGTQGTLQLGNSALTNANLNNYAGLLAQIGSSLSSDGDILIYGCDVAQGAEGQSFINSFSQFTGADVAASIDRTGGTLLGGDSILEASVGMVEAAALDFSAYSAVLAPNTAPTFLIGSGKLKTDIGASIDSARDVAIQTDGKYVVVGNSGSTHVLTRYNVDGSLDTTFSADGKVFGATGTATGVALQADGRIVVVGDGFAGNIALYRYNTNGSLNTTVTTDLGAVDIARDVLVQSDGKIVVAGYTNVSAGSSDFAVLRFNTNLTADTTFDVDGRVTTNFGNDDRANSVAIQTDGKIIAVGSWDGGSSDFAVARYTTSGGLDTTFSGDGLLNVSFSAGGFGNAEFAQSVALQADGKIVIAGYTNTPSAGANNDFGLIRLNTNGTLDTTFDSDGKVTTDFGNDDRANSIVIQSDGKILAAGSWDGGTSDFALARYNSNGSLDTTFGGGDGLVNLTFNNTFFGNAEFAYGVKLQADGRILVIGDTNTSTTNGDTDFALARLNPDGSLDTTFSSDGKVITDIGATLDVARNVQIQTDGKLVVAGHNATQVVLTRYNADGSLDSTFSGDGKVFGLTGTAEGLTLQSDGTIVVAVGGTGIANLAFARYNTNGVQVGSFSTNFGTDFTMTEDVVLQGDGKIVVAGTSLSNFALARFNTNGSLDSTFDADGRVTTDVAAVDNAAGVVVQADGKIVVAGSAFVGASANFAVARYNTNGSLDTTFGGGDGKIDHSFGADDVATSVALQSNGKIVIAGYTNAIAGPNNDFALMRLNTDGTLDTTFDTDGKVTTNFGNDDKANSVVIQSDGKIIAAGSWDGGASDFALARYNSNGSLDTTFGGDGLVNLTLNDSFFGDAEFGQSVKLQADGKIVVVGYTNTATANVDNDFAIARLNTDGSLDTTFNISVNTLGGIVAFTEQSVTPVAIDNSVIITDAELTATHYSGATLTLARQGGANAQDVFSATGGALSALTEGNALVLSGVIIGGVVQNSGGLLLLSFNSNANQARVNQTLSSLAYLNTSSNPAAQVKLDWTFNDGNAGAQGTGGALSTVGTSTINIALINDAPTAPANATTYTNPNVTYTFALPDFGFSDAEDANLAAVRIDTIPATGNLRFDGFNVTTTGVEFAAADILAGRLTFAPGTGGGSFEYKVKDSGALFNAALSVMNVSTSGEIWNGGPGNDTHTGTPLSDSLNGLGGNDTINGGLGNDTINGGADIDTAIFSGLLNAYTITRSGLTTTVSGSDGTDTLTGIERLQFGDVTKPLTPHEDYNGDGKSDLLLMHDNGRLYLWGMDGINIVSGGEVGVLTTDWKVADASGDYNGDSKCDLLLRNDSGRLYLWGMDGNNIVSGGEVGTLSADWKIADAAGDYNGDGKSDILLRNDNGRLYLWGMDGNNIVSGGEVGTLSADWKIADAAGDYNGDGKSDILLRNDNGRLYLWQMDGNAIASGGEVGTLTADWKIAESAVDYNGDGRSDLMLRNDNGRVYEWQMDGVTIVGGGEVATLPPEWGLL